jgi:small-conductance mechanosensitive channel
MKKRAKGTHAKMENRRFLVCISALLFAVFLFVLSRQEGIFRSFPAGGTLLFILALVVAFYSGAMLVLAGHFRHRPRGQNELGMLASVIRFTAVVGALAAGLHATGLLSGSWTAVAGFAGLLVGWSLQAPVSGLAAWLLISLRRPFRVGDRVKLQEWDLRGDITRIGMMYTQLNQVGGTVGSEDLAGRTILVPNAMLFQNIVVNYTPHQASAFVLDEVIVRMTYNSDWATAERILLEAAVEVSGDIIQEKGIQPYIRAQMYEYGIQLFLRYMAPATDRPRMVYELTKRIVDGFSRSPNVDFALPFVFSQRTGMQLGAHPRAATVMASGSESPDAMDRVGQEEAELWFSEQ